MSEPPAPSSNGFRRWRRIGVALLVLAGAGAAAFVFVERPQESPDTGAEAQKPAAESRPVEVRVVHFEPASRPRMLVGTLRARIESDRGFRVTGKIAERKIDAGTHVRAGDLLARLDETDFRLARESAEAELAAARSSARQAMLERERIAELRARGWSTEQAAERQRAVLDEAEGRVKRAERQVELAMNSQSYAELKAESDGIVVAVLAEAGQVVAAGQPVFRIARDGDREAQVSIPEQDLALAREATAEVALWSAPDTAHKARLRELSPSADPATRTFLARYAVEGLAPDAPLGMTVTLGLTAPASGKAARLPLSAVLNEGGGPEVFVFDKATGALARKSVQILAYDFNDALVSGGIVEGDEVVTLGIHTLREGQKVRALAEAAH